MPRISDERLNDLVNSYEALASNIRAEIAQLRERVATLERERDENAQLRGTITAGPLHGTTASTAGLLRGTIEAGPWPVEKKTQIHPMK